MLQEKVRVERIQYLEAKTDEKRRLDNELAELPTLKAEQAEIERLRRAEQAHASALKELVPAFDGLAKAQPDLDSKFIDLVEKLGAFLNSFTEREIAIAFLGKRCKRAARLSVERHLTRDQIEKPGMEIAFSVQREEHELWQESGGTDPALCPFPLDAFKDRPDLEQLASQLVGLILAGKRCYDPQIANVYLKGLNAVKHVPASVETFLEQYPPEHAK